MTATNVFRGDKLHVQARKCDTCIYRPGNLMHLEPGRVEAMEEESRKGMGVITCHKTLHDPEKNATCRGYFDKVVHDGSVPLLQVAQRLGFVEEDEELLS